MKQNKTPKYPTPLSTFLKETRYNLRLSLREIAALEKGSVSNGYLSQLENGWAKTPSPIVLKYIADVYKVPYTKLMKLAGYL